MGAENSMRDLRKITIPVRSDAIAIPNSQRRKRNYVDQAKLLGGSSNGVDVLMHGHYWPQQYDAYVTAPSKVAKKG